MFAPAAASPLLTLKNKTTFYLTKNNSLLIYTTLASVPASFRGLCAGENILLPYRDLFLHYRYLNSDERPVIKGKPISCDVSATRPKTKISRKIEQLVSRVARPF